MQLAISCRRRAAVRKPRVSFNTCRRYTCRLLPSAYSFPPIAYSRGNAALRRRFRKPLLTDDRDLDRTRVLQLFFNPFAQFFRDVTRAIIGDGLR